MKKIIKLTESDLERIVLKVLNEQSAIGAPNFENLKYGNSFLPKGVKEVQSILTFKGYYVGKNGADGVLGPNTKKAIMKFQKDNGIKQTGNVGPITAKALGVQPLTSATNQKSPTTATNKKSSTTATTKPQYGKCIALSKEECDKISSTKEVLISSGSEKRCSAYMVKCLSQYDSELYGGNAWDVFNNVKNKGSVKYNAFTSGEINWNGIWSQMVKNKVSKSVCEKHAATDDADKQVKSAVPSIVTNSVPSSPKVSISSLNLGDIVGLYHKNSGNKGMAFCQRVLKRGLDDGGNVKDKGPFTFNSHVGFVGAIKNGIPVIVHNVHGSHMATPATQMMSKDSEDMIVWVVSDNEVLSSIENTPKSEKSSWFDKVNPFS